MVQRAESMLNRVFSRGISYADVVVATAIMSIAIIPLSTLIGNYKTVIQKEEKLYNISSFADEVMQTVVSKGFKERFSASTALGMDEGEAGTDWRSLDDVDDYDSLEINIGEYFGLKCSVFVAYANVPSTSDTISTAVNNTCTEFKEVNVCIYDADTLSTAGQLYNLRAIRAFGESIDEDEVITEALYFDGNNDYAEFTASSQFSSGNDEFQILLSVWLEEPADTSQERILIDNPGLYHITLQNNRFWLKTRNTNSQSNVKHQISNQIQYNRWNKLELYKTVTDVGSNIFGTCGDMGEYHQSELNLTMTDTIINDDKLYLGGSPNFAGKSVEGYMKDFTFFRYPVYWFPPSDSSKNLKSEMVKSNHFDESERFTPEQLVFNPQKHSAKPGYYQNIYEPRNEKNLVMGGSGKVLTVSKIDTTPIPEAIKIDQNDFNYSISIQSGEGNSSLLGTFNNPLINKGVQARVLNIIDTTSTDYEKYVMLFGLTDSQGGQGKYVKYYWTTTPDPENYLTNMQQAVFEQTSHRFKGVVKIADLSGTDPDIIFLTAQGIVVDIEDSGNDFIRQSAQPLNTDIVILQNPYITDFIIADANQDGKQDILYVQSIGARPSMHWAINPGFAVDSLTLEASFESDFITDCVNCFVGNLDNEDYELDLLNINSDNYPDIISVPNRKNEYFNEMKISFWTSDNSQNVDFAIPSHLVTTNYSFPYDETIEGVRRVYGGQTFTAGSNANLTRIKVAMWSDASGSPFLNLYEWNDGNVSEIISTSAIGVDIPSSPDQFALATFTFPDSPMLTFGTEYMFFISECHRMYVDTNAVYNGGNATYCKDEGNGCEFIEMEGGVDMNFEIRVTPSGPDVQVQSYIRGNQSDIDSLFPEDYTAKYVQDNGDTADYYINHFDEKIMPPFVLDADGDLLDDVLIAYSYGTEKVDKNWTSDSTWTFEVSDTAIQKAFVIKNSGGTMMEVTPATIDTSGWSSGIPDYVDEIFIEGQENLLLNSDFEEGTFNLNPTNSMTFANENALTGWETTSPDNTIEIWSNGFQGTPSFSGDYFMEINAHRAAMLYQSIDVFPGNTGTWQVAHRGRWNVDVMHIKIGPSLDNMVTQQMASTAQTAWEVYSGEYIVPNGVARIYIGFEAMDVGSVGNFIDNVVFKNETERVVNKYFVKQNNSSYRKVGNSYKIEEDNDNIRYVSNFDPPFMIASFELNNDADNGDAISGSQNVNSFNEFVFRGAAVSYQGAEWKKLPEFPTIMFAEQE